MAAKMTSHKNSISRVEHDIRAGFIYAMEEKKTPLTSFFKSIRIFRPAGQANMQRVLWDLGPASLKG